MKLFQAVPPAPVLWLSLEECAKCAEIAFMPEEISFLLSLGPELDGKGERVHSLTVAANIGATKVYVLQVMLLSMKVSNLPNVVTGFFLAFSFQM